VRVDSVLERKLLCVLARLERRSVGLVTEVTRDCSIVPSMVVISSTGRAHPA
jgi:hypothetical protein